nr:hydantoinase/oxoprolinase family protein [Gammaproteobacteria bacterium]
AVAICLINAYLNPVHERAIAAAIEAIAPGTTTCLSSDVHPEIREYERMSTTVVNASLIPVVDQYLAKLEAALSAFSRQFLIMQSNGGLISAANARRRPAYMIESGPAAGVLAAAQLAREVSLAQVLSFDMGGTTAKACLIEDGQPLEKAGGEIGGASTTSARLFGSGGHAIRAPWLDIVEVGAGGGSIAWVDDGGALRVGPNSAGAAPGPACYPNGGCHPTVTDANLVLGYMNPVAIAGDRLPLNKDAAIEAIRADVAEPLGIEVERAAFGVTQVANATMMRALRAVSTERGRNPREFTLVAFGGAGPMHAAALAEAVGISQVLVPTHPGVFSAVGLLLADYRHDHLRSIATDLDTLDADTLNALFDDLEAQARQSLGDDGVPASAIEFQRRLDLKYGYQVSELTVSWPNGADVCAELRRAFAEAHSQSFGYARPDDPIEVVNVRLRASASSNAPRFRDIAQNATLRPPLARAPTFRPAYFGPHHGYLTTAIYSRFDLETPREGPFIVEEPDTTVVVPPNWLGELNDVGAILLRYHGVL